MSSLSLASTRKALGQPPIWSETMNEAHGAVMTQPQERTTSDRRSSCHRCGNMRKQITACSRCPHIFCAKCTQKMETEHGADVFTNGCPVVSVVEKIAPRPTCPAPNVSVDQCQHLCCCVSRSPECSRVFHCYKKCPLSKGKLKMASLAARSRHVEPNRDCEDGTCQGKILSGALSPPPLPAEGKRADAGGPAKKLQKRTYKNMTACARFYTMARGAARRGIERDPALFPPVVLLNQRSACPLLSNGWPTPLCAGPYPYSMYSADMLPWHRWVPTPTMQLANPPSVSPPPLPPPTVPWTAECDGFGKPHLSPPWDCSDLHLHEDSPFRTPEKPVQQTVVPSTPPYDGRTADAWDSHCSLLATEPVAGTLSLLDEEDSDALSFSQLMDFDDFACHGEDVFLHSDTQWKKTRHDSEGLTDIDALQF